MNPIEIESYECGAALPGKSIVRWLVVQSSGRRVTALILVIDRKVRGACATRLPFGNWRPENQCPPWARGSVTAR